jgi:hypothetical protein
MMRVPFLSVSSNSDYITNQALAQKVLSRFVKIPYQVLCECYANDSSVVYFYKRVICIILRLSTYNTLLLHLLFT